MEDKPIKKDSPHSREQHKAPKRNIAVDKEASSSDVDRAQDCFNNFNYKISKIKSNYSSVVEEIQPDINSSNHDAMKEQIVSDEEEFCLLSNSLLMRKVIFLMGIRVFASKRDFEVDVDFKDAEYLIDYLINKSEFEFQCGKFESAEMYMKKADDIYTSVTTIKQKETHKKFINNAHTPNDTINKDSTKDKQTGNADTTLKSYKITVIGDDVDLIRCYKIAETALLAKDLKKAERWLLKAERIKPTDIAKQLMKKLKQAKNETTEAEKIPNEVIDSLNEAEKKYDSDIVTSNAQKAEKCHNIAWEAIEDGDFKNANSFIYKTQRICPEIDAKGTQIKLETCVLPNNKNEDFGPLIDKKDLLDQNIFYERCTEFKESTIPEPKFVVLNTESAFASNTDDKDCNRTADNYNMDMVDECLWKGRISLTRNNIEKAENFTRNAEELCPTVRGKGFIEDIDKTKQLNIGSQYLGHNRVSEGKLQSNNVTQTDSLIEASNVCFQEALKEYGRDNYDKAEDILSLGAKMYPSPAKEALSKLIKYARSKDLLRIDDTLIKDSNEELSCNSKNVTTEIGSIKNQGNQLILRAINEFCDGNCNEARKNLEDYKEPRPEMADEANKYIESIKHHAKNHDFKDVRPEIAENVTKFIQSYSKQNEQCDYNDLSKTEYRKQYRKYKTDRNCANVDSFGTDNNKDFVTMQTLSEQKQVEICISEAKKEFEAGNFDKFKDILNRVKLVYPDIYRLRLRKESDDVSDTNKDKKTENRDEAKGCPLLKNRTDANRDQQAYCIEIANKAVSEGYLEKAEKLCQKAIRMNPNADVEIRTLIKNLQDEKEKKKDEEKQTEKERNEEKKQNENRHKEDSKATKPPTNTEIVMDIDENLKLEVEECYEKAELAYNEGHFDKAERLLQKSIRMAQPHPFEIANDLLFKLQWEKKKEKEKTVKNEKGSEEKLTETKADQDPAVQEIINKALDAIAKEHYYVAEFWLQKVQRIQIEEQTKEHITILINEIYSSIVNLGANSKKDEVTEKEEFIQSAEKYLAVAKEKFISENYHDARHNAMISDCFAESKEARQLIQDVIKKEYEIGVERHEASGKSKRNKSRNQGGAYKRQADIKANYKMFQADKYLEDAEEALRFGCLEKAEELVKKSLDLNSFSVKAKTLHIEIEKKLGSKEGILRRALKKTREGISTFFSNH